MQVTCAHCGNTVYASWGDTGIVDELTKRVGWRPDRRADPSPERRAAPAAAQEVDQVAAELRDLGLEVSESEVADWLAEDAPPGDAGLEHPPAGLGAVVDWFERKEASVTPMRPEILDRLAPASHVRADIAWQRTEEGLPACSGHCFEQLSFCTTCNLPRTAPAHRRCPTYVAPCTLHTATVVPFPRER